MTEPIIITATLIILIISATIGVYRSKPVIISLKTKRNTNSKKPKKDLFKIISSFLAFAFSIIYYPFFVENLDLQDTKNYLTLILKGLTVLTTGVLYFVILFIDINKQNYRK